MNNSDPEIMDNILGLLFFANVIVIYFLVLERKLDDFLIYFKVYVFIIKKYRRDEERTICKPSDT